MSQYRGFGGDDLPDPRILLDQFKRNFRLILFGLLALIIMALLAGSVFTVEPEEKAVVLRFGEPLPEHFDPGLHFKIPIVDEVFIAPVERQHRVEIGFRSTPGKQTTVNEVGYNRESLMLTGDLSLAHVRWSVLYRIKNIEHYLFNVKDPEENVRDVAKGIMRNVIGDYSLDEVLLGKYDEIAVVAKEGTQRALDDIDSGVEVTNVELQKSEVPPDAKKAFDDLNRSVADVKRQIVEAYARRKGIRGEAEQHRQTIIGAAQGRMAQIVANANGEAGAFTAKLREYQRAPGITKKWLYLETMTRVLSAVDQKILLESSTGTGSDVVKLLPLESILTSTPTVRKTAKPVKAAPATAGGAAKPRMTGGGAK